MTSMPLQRVGQVGLWAHLDSLAIGDLRAFAQRCDELGYGAIWVPETVGREPFALMALLSSATERIGLGTSICSIYARDAVTANSAAMTIEEASGGRFILGLGVSHPHLVTKVRGHPYARPVSTMADYLGRLRGAPYRGPATLDTDGPPILIAALRERMLRLAAREADGAFPYLVSAERLAWMRAIVDEEAAQAGRARPFLAVTLPVVHQADPTAGREAARAYLAPYLRTPNYHASWRAQGMSETDWQMPASDRLVDAMVAIGDGPSLVRRVAEMRAAGADHVALIALGPDGTTEDLASLESLVKAAILRA